MKTSFPTSARSKRPSGFTLMEMIFVLAIITVLVGMGIFALTGVIGDAEITRARSDLKTMSMNLVRYRTQTMMIPSQAQGLEALVKKPSGSPQPKQWRQMMTEEGLLDPWSRPYQYKNPGTKSNENYDIFSMGEDGLPDTEDDIGNW